MQNTQMEVNLTGMDGMGEQSLGEKNVHELFPYLFYSFPLTITNGTTEWNNYISHYLRDDQRDAKLQTFKYTALMVLKRPQPQPSMGQEISLQVLTTVG